MYIRTAMEFRDWLLTESVKTRLAIFDYDKTLANTPERPEGWVGTPVRGKKQKDWWTHPDSLSRPMYGGQLNGPIVREFEAAKSDPNTHTVLITGRNGIRMAPMVRGHLRQAGLYGKRIIAPSYAKAHRRAAEEDTTHPHEQHDTAHEEYYSGDFRTEPDFPKTESGKPSSDTLDHKRYIVGRLMNDGIQRIDFWDDREAHLQPFLQMFEKMFGNWKNLKEVFLHHVQDDKIIQHSMSRDNPQWQIQARSLF